METDNISRTLDSIRNSEIVTSLHNIPFSDSVSIFVAILALLVSIIALILTYIQHRHNKSNSIANDIKNEHILKEFANIQPHMKNLTRFQESSNNVAIMELENKIKELVVKACSGKKRYVYNIIETEFQKIIDNEEYWFTNGGTSIFWREYKRAYPDWIEIHCPNITENIRAMFSDGGFEIHLNHDLIRNGKFGEPIRKVVIGSKTSLFGLINTDIFLRVEQTSMHERRVIGAMVASGFLNQDMHISYYIDCSRLRLVDLKIPYSLIHEISSEFRKAAVLGGAHRVFNALARLDDDWRYVHQYVALNIIKDDRETKNIRFDPSPIYY